MTMPSTTLEPDVELGAVEPALNNTSDSGRPESSEQVHVTIPTQPINDSSCSITMLDIYNDGSIHECGDEEELNTILQGISALELPPNSRRFCFATAGSLGGIDRLEKLLDELHHSERGNEFEGREQALRIPRYGNWKEAYWDCFQP